MRVIAGQVQAEVASPKLGTDGPLTCGTAVWPRQKSS